MKNYSVRLYQKSDYELWNSFLEKAKNATFLFHRDFMEYHSDKFEDCSLLVFDDTTVLAALPANKVESTLFSHQGLSYGGLVLLEKVKLMDVILIFKNILIFLNQIKIKKLNIKMIPSFYNECYSEELDYCLFLLNAKLLRCDTFSVINLQNKIKITSGRKEGIIKGIENNLVIKEEQNFKLFWNKILIPNLQAKHLATPVHNLNEIELLYNRFPDNIRQFNVYHNDEIIAGTTIFESKNVAHSQYISGNETKNKTGSLDFLHHHLITTIFKDKAFFDFGTSNEQQGRKLNKGLLFWKESFGAKTITQNFYEIETINYHLLENIFI